MGDELEFVVFQREEDGLPRLFSCVEVGKSQRPDLTYAWAIRLPYEAQANGFPAGNELGRVYKIEDQLTAPLERLGGVFMGHSIGSGGMTVIFRAPRPAPSEIEVKTGLLRKDKFQVMVREDPNWEWHEEKFAPTQREFHVSRNRQLMDALEKQGDRHEVVRPVDFAAFFPSAADRDGFLAAIEPHGYRLNEEGKWEDEEGGYWCGLVHATAIDENTIADCCVLVENLARAHKGELDGWATPVQKG